MCNLYSITTNQAAIIALLRPAQLVENARHALSAPSQEVALSSHFCVCSSVQPGTAKHVGAATPLLGQR
jgi:hypothetical protein